VLLSLYGALSAGDRWHRQATVPALTFTGSSTHSETDVLLSGEKDRPLVVQAYYQPTYVLVHGLRMCVRCLPCSLGEPADYTENLTAWDALIHVIANQRRLEILLNQRRLEILLEPQGTEGGSPGKYSSCPTM
jgi:hypothetical protein